MIRSLILCFLAAWLCAHEAAAEACDFKNLPAQHELKRGINLSSWWEGNRRTIDSEALKNLRALGFDFVRLPVDPALFESEENDNVRALRCDVAELVHLGFTVVVDLHQNNAARRDFAALAPEEALVALKTMWSALAPALQDSPPSRVMLELYNEPQRPNAEWWSTQEKLASHVRGLFPHHTLIAMGNIDDGLSGLTRMQPYADKNMIYDFHFYEPMAFTHHGAAWTRFNSRAPIAYPATDTDREDADAATEKYMDEGWNRQKLRAFLSSLFAWKKRTHARIACLEFGVYRSYTDEKSRANWLSDIRIILEEAHVPWALWEYKGGFGLVNGSGETDESMAKALDLAYGGKP